jgi:tryptophan-rich sensory protein
MQRKERRGGSGWALAGYLAASFGVAALGSLATARSVNTWYRTLRRPAWTPPGWLFGPVWTLLYTLMALAAWRVQEVGQRDMARESNTRQALVVWWVQLGLNLAWSVAFFGLRQVGPAVAVIAALWAAIAVCLARAAVVSRGAALLLTPYLAWTTFAAALNARIWWLNRPR